MQALASYKAIGDEVEEEDEESEDEEEDEEPLPFHHSNIAEKRLAAYIARAVPMMMFLATIGCTIGGVVHLVMLPNYKEDESILTRTLTALKQARGSERFRIMLAMEEREGSPAVERAEKLQSHFKLSFARFSYALHPTQLTQGHLDGADGPEIPGKSSNLKWATQQAFKECAADGISLDRVLLTVGDADCIFHPSYFAQAGAEFDELRAENNGQALWTMWQAPQLPFINYIASTTPSRIWGYISSVYENGGVGGLQCGGYHMTFSSFTIPLQLVKVGEPWDGDVIADDHHNYLKCFLFSVYYQLLQQTEDGQFVGINPPLVLRPIMLPVKSVGVEAGTCKAGWKARFNQAKRHSQGVAEFSYILLGTWRMLCNLPVCSYSCCLVFKMIRVMLLPCCDIMLPVCHPIPFAVQTIIWIYHDGLWGEHIPQCPKHYTYKFDDPFFYICWVGGGLNLQWPMIVPLALVMLSNYCMISVAFLEPVRYAEGSEADGEAPSIWYSLGSDMKCRCKRLALAGLVFLDIALLLPIVMPIYGIIPAVLAYWNCMVRGNKFDFKSAAKGKAPQMLADPQGEAETESESDTDDDAPKGVMSGKHFHWEARPSRQRK